MKEFKGTSGEWFVSDDTSEINKKISEKGYHFISTESGYYSDESDSGFEISGCMSIHDAKLIAAAPDLLEATQRAAEVYSALLSDGYFAYRDELSAAYAAIAKALGESK